MSDSPQPQIDPVTFFVPIPEPGKGVSAFVQVKLLVEYQFVWFSLAFQRDGAWSIMLVERCELCYVL